VTIPPGVTVTLDTDSPRLIGLNLDGTLRFAEADLTLTAGYIMLHGAGLLEIGTPEAPFTHQARIVLTEPESNQSIMEMGSKFLGAMMGGTISMHGSSAEKLSWTKLAETVEPGMNTLTLLEAPGWEVGDQIVIAPTGMDPLEAEKVTITAISDTQVRFTPALAYQHWGTLQEYAGRTLDQRAAVGLLTRNIVITSDDIDPESDQTRDRFGGHIMIMAGGKAYLSGSSFANWAKRRA
jgi:cell migration-inducing and hyaluronan-binding protein